MHLKVSVPLKKQKQKYFIDEGLAGHRVMSRSAAVLNKAMQKAEKRVKFPCKWENASL